MDESGDNTGSEAPLCFQHGVGKDVAFLIDDPRIAQHQRDLGVLHENSSNLIDLSRIPDVVLVTEKDKVSGGQTNSLLECQDPPSVRIVLVDPYSPVADFLHQFQRSIG